MKKLLIFPIMLVLSTFALVSCENDAEDQIEDTLEEAEDAVD